MQQMRFLMKKGKSLWLELDEMGKEFKQISHQIKNLNREKAKQTNSFDQRWVNLEIQKELDQLRKEVGLKQ